MYTVCYVLADGKDLFFYNQLLISLSSLRKREFSGRVCVVMDTETAQLLKEKNRCELEEFKAETVIVQIPDEYTQKEKSRYIKTSLREYVTGDFLYIDTDTVIADVLPDEVSDSDIALVREWNEEAIEDSDITSIVALYNRCNYIPDFSFGYYNSGVIWVRDTEIARQFFIEWHKEWKHCRSCGVSQDQPSLNHVNCKMGGIITLLDGRWNVQICCVTSLKHLKTALIIHYYNVKWDRMHTIYPLANPEIQAGGYQSAEIQKIIAAPKDALLPAVFLRLDGVTEEVIHGKAFYTLKKLYTKHRTVYRGINYVLSLPEKIGKKFRKSR